MHSTIAIAVVGLATACAGPSPLAGSSADNRGPVVIRSCRAQPIPAATAPPPPDAAVATPPADAAPAPAAAAARDGGVPPAPAPPPTAPPPEAAPAAAAPVDAGPAPYPGDTDGYARNVVMLALEDSSGIIAGCAGPSGGPVQRGFDVTMTITSARIDDARVDGLMDPSVELCIAGAVRGLTLGSAPPAGPLAVRCELVLRSR